MTSSLWDGAYFFELHCPCHLTMCKIEACRCCLESFQFVSSCHSGENGPFLLVFSGWSSLDWLTVGFLSFVLVITFTFHKGTSVYNFLSISNSEADISELFLVVRSADMAKYVSLSSSIHFRRVFLMAWMAVSTNPLLWRKSGLKVLSMKSHDLESFLNSRG